MPKFSNVLDALAYATAKQTAPDFPRYSQARNEAVAAFHERGNEIRRLIRDVIERDTAYARSRATLDRDLIAAVESVWLEERR